MLTKLSFSVLQGVLETIPGSIGHTSGAYAGGDARSSPYTSLDGAVCPVPALLVWCVHLLPLLLRFPLAVQKYAIR